MLETKMISFMKWTKDTMSNPPSDATIDSLVKAAKSAGATHCELAHPFGLSNTASEMKRWADKIHAAGMNITVRSADVDMEGLYGHAQAVGPNRKPTQYYIDEAVNFIKANPIFKDGDEFAPFPERTEGIFQDATSWIWPNDPGTYGAFFVSLADSCAAAFASIGKNIKCGLSSNNASELLSGWMSKAVSDKYGYVCIDHYVDGNPTQLDSDLRTIFSKYGKPIYLQESAPDRFTVPSAALIQSYFQVLTKLVTDGVLARYGYWGMWSGTPEACINADFTLNAVGLGLQAFQKTTPTPTPTPDLTPRVVALETAVANLTKRTAALEAKLAIIKSIL